MSRGQAQRATSSSSFDSESDFTNGGPYAYKDPPWLLAPTDEYGFHKWYIHGKGVVSILPKAAVAEYLRPGVADWFDHDPVEPWFGCPTITVERGGAEPVVKEVVLPYLFRNRSPARCVACVRAALPQPCTIIAWTPPDPQTGQYPHISEMGKQESALAYACWECWSGRDRRGERKRCSREGKHLVGENFGKRGTFQDKPLETFSIEDIYALPTGFYFANATEAQKARTRHFDPTLATSSPARSVSPPAQPATGAAQPEGGSAQATAGPVQPQAQSARGSAQPTGRLAQPATSSAQSAARPAQSASSSARSPERLARSTSNPVQSASGLEEPISGPARSASPPTHFATGSATGSTQSAVGPAQSSRNSSAFPSDLIRRTARLSLGPGSSDTNRRTGNVPDKRVSPSYNRASENPGPKKRGRLDGPAQSRAGPVAGPSSALAITSNGASSRVSSAPAIPRLAQRQDGQVSRSVSMSAQSTSSAGSDAASAASPPEMPPRRSADVAAREQHRSGPEMAADGVPDHGTMSLDHPLAEGNTDAAAGSVADDGTMTPDHPMEEADADIVATGAADDGTMAFDHPMDEDDAAPMHAEVAEGPGAATPSDVPSTPNVASEAPAHDGSQERRGGARISAAFTPPITHTSDIDMSGTQPSNVWTTERDDIHRRVKPDPDTSTSVIKTEPVELEDPTSPTNSTPNRDNSRPLSGVPRSNSPGGLLAQSRSSSILQGSSTALTRPARELQGTEDLESRVRELERKVAVLEGEKDELKRERNAARREAKAARQAERRLMRHMHGIASQVERARRGSVDE